MTPSPDPTRLELLLLSRLYTTAKKAPTRSDLRATLTQLAGRDLDPRTVDAHLDATLERLADSGAITASPLRLTGEGRARIRDELGLSSPRPWREVKAAVLPALGVGLAPTDRRAKALGQIDELRKLVTALATGARRPDADAVRTALGRRWLFGHAPLAPAPAASGPATATSTATVAGPATASRESAPADKARASDLAPYPSRDARSSDSRPDLGSFARTVLGLAARVDDSGRFGDHKVYIAALWERANAEEPALSRLGEAEFKEKLVAAHRAGWLTLERADFVPAMERARVEASEARYRNAAFHFLVTGDPRSS